MATQDHNLPKVPVSPVAVTRLLSRQTRVELEGYVSVAIDLLDVLDGDPDELDTNDGEDDFARTALSNAYGANSGPGCYVGDPGDTSATEWHTRGRNKMHDGLSGKNGWRLGEDVEDDDPDFGLDEGEPNFVAVSGGGAGCPIADDDTEHDGREEEHDAEREQMYGDVPMLPVVSAEHNVFNDERTFLGIGNLQSSFVGKDIRSADTGALHTGGSPTLRNPPGVPV